ncbi:hypothetical protein J4427_02860, partial [Candidatus Woesearchaeota archaeon]|nr:hypothetical protein [Candidatus Woesearchaeota archaeon]
KNTTIEEEVVEPVAEKSVIEETPAQEEIVEETEEVVEEPVVEENKTADIEVIGNDIVNSIDKIETQDTTSIPVQPIAEITTSVAANLESIDLVPTINKMMLESDSFDLLINNESHAIKLESVSNDSVFLSIQSGINYVLLKAEETKSVDINNDGISDLEITFNGFKNGKADLTFKKFEVKKPSIFSRLYDKINSLFFISAVKDYQNYIIIAVIVILLIIIIVKTKFHKKIIDFFEEDAEEKK